MTHFNPEQHAQLACIHNLPVRAHIQLIGRQKYFNQLCHFISEEYDERIIRIVGIGGVGKTSLALEVAYSYVSRRDEFGMILFASAQSEILRPNGVSLIRTPRPVRTLQDLCSDIAPLCERRGLIMVNPDDQVSELQTFLSEYQQSFLLILDNLESLETEERQSIMKFLKGIRGRFKTIITTRTSEEPDITLPQLSEAASLELIDSLLHRNQLFASQSFKERIMQLNGGIPLAIQYAVGILAVELSEEAAIQKLSDPKDDLTLYCFKKLVAEIKSGDPLAYRLLLAASLTSNGCSIKALIEIANLSKDRELNSAQTSLNLLIRCSLIYQENKLYKLLPLTRRYVLSKLDEEPDNTIIDKWVSRSISLCEINGGEDKGEWHRKYDLVDAEWKNIKNVFEWCQSQQDYDSCKILWKSLLRFTYLYGYWTDRLSWTQSLIELSTQNREIAILAEATAAKAWITLLREDTQDLLEAENCLKDAWNLRSACTPYVSCTIAINLGVLYTRLHDFNNADQWFRKANSIRKTQANEIEKSEDKRLELRYILYYAELFYRKHLTDQGKVFDLKRASIMYQIAQNKAEGIDWLRFQVKAIERRIHLLLISQGQTNANLEEAEKLLNTWYPVLKDNRDRRRLAFYKRDYAILFYKKKDFRTAKDWASEAKIIFESLKMRRRADNMADLISRCINSINFERINES